MISYSDSAHALFGGNATAHPHPSTDALDGAWHVAASV